MKKYGSTIWLLVILAFLPLEWYESVIPIDFTENLTPIFRSMNGLQMFIHNFFEILTIYLLCLAIQYLVIKNQRGYLIAAISKILLIGQISFAPISAFYDISIPSISTLKIWFQRANLEIWFQRANIYIFPIYKLGFFLAVLCILISIIWDVVSWIQSRKN